MAYVPYSPAINDVYWLTSPGGITARFNGDPSDANWVGALTDVSGLDSAEVRESSEDNVQADGGTHGNFWFGRRPIVLAGTCYGHASQLARDAKLDKIMRASLAMQGDAELHWVAAGSGVEMMTWVRRQQPVRLSGGWVKDFQIPLVSQYARLHSAGVASGTNTGASPSVTVENWGSYPSTPILRVTGPVTNPVITNTTTGLVVKVKSGVAIAAGTYVDIDTLNHTATTNLGVDWTANLDFTLSTWPTLITGNNTLTVTGTGTTGATSLTVTYRHTWI